MAKLTASQKDIYHRVALMGLSGTGKTTLLSKLAAKFRLTILDLENGKDVFTKLPPDQLENINYVRIPDSASYPIGVQTLMTLFKTGKASICVEHGKHDCAICKKDAKPVDVVDFSTFTEEDILVVESGSQLSASILSYVTKDKSVEYKPERDDWGALRKYSEFFSSQWQAYPKNLIVTFHCVEATMEDDKVKLVPNFGSKDMSTKVAKAFSDVIYTDIRNKKHVAVSASTAYNNVLTKSRSDFKIESLEEPSLVPLFDNSAVVVKEVKPAPGQTALSNLAKLKQGLGGK